MTCENFKLFNNSCTYVPYSRCRSAEPINLLLVRDDVKSYNTCTLLILLLLNRAVFLPIVPVFIMFGFEYISY
jgi:hypothetical protein